jgi:hypothetical protein
VKLSKKQLKQIINEETILALMEEGPKISKKNLQFVLKLAGRSKKDINLAMEKISNKVKKETAIIKQIKDPKKRKIAEKNLVKQIGNYVSNSFFKVAGGIGMSAESVISLLKNSQAKAIDQALKSNKLRYGLMKSAGIGIGKAATMPKATIMQKLKKIAGKNLKFLGRAAFKAIRIALIVQLVGLAMADKWTEFFKQLAINVAIWGAIKLAIAWPPVLLFYGAAYAVYRTFRGSKPAGGGFPVHPSTYWSHPKDDPDRRSSNWRHADRPEGSTFGGRAMPWFTKPDPYVNEQKG